MKAILLAAGYGTRLGAVTKDIPKPMIQIAGRPVIEHIITQLNIWGISDIIVNLHYLPHVVTQYLGSRALYYYEPKLLGHLGTILALKEWVKDDDFFVINADTLSSLHYGWMKEFHQPNTITVHMDEWRAIGAWIYSKEYFTNHNLPVVPYREMNCVWFDIGTPERLKVAKEYYEGANQVS